MTTSLDPLRRFTSDMLADVDEPILRYFRHAISEGAALPNGVRMAPFFHAEIGAVRPTL